MAEGRPVVATSVGALPELVHHEQTGLIVPPTDPALLASAIERLLEDRDAAAAFGRAGHERARATYHTPRVLPRILAAYEDGSDYFYHVRAAGVDHLE